MMSYTAHAQGSVNKLKSEGDAFFRLGDYRQALNYYVRYNQYKSEVRIVRKRLAICQFYNNQVDKALDNLELLMEGDIVIHDADIYYYHAECLAHQNEFERAAESYKKYASKVRSKTDRNNAIHKIKNCAAGIDLIYTEPIGILENVGPLVNSIEDDVAPLFSENYVQRFYFASNFDRNEANPLNAKKSFDIYSTELKDAEWMDPTLFPVKFSTDLDEKPLDFLNDGKVMYFQRGKQAESSILIDTFSGDTSSLRTKEFTTSDMPIFPELGDQNVTIYGATVVLFSSKRPGGYGGYDLYYTQRSRDGWSIPVNLGSEINTAFDEVDPFLTSNGASLYFSSNRSTSIGGYDVFKTRFESGSNKWGPIINIGLPINSAGDDRGIQLSKNNNSFIFYSDRKTGYGGFDIFILYAKELIGDMTAVDGQLKPGFLPTTVTDVNEATTTPKTLTRSDTPVVEMTTNTVPTANIKQTASNTSTLPKKEIEENITELYIPRVRVDPVLYPKKTISVHSIYYSANDEVLNPQSIDELNKVADLIRGYPKLSLTLYSHAPASKGPIYFDIYLSAKRAEQVVNYLHEKNVTKTALSIVSVGNQFPYASQVINDQLSGYSTKLNRRIDLVVSGGEHYNLDFIYTDAGLEADEIDIRQKTLEQLSSGITFKVQVKESNQVYKDNVLAENQHPLIEKIANKNSYLYTIGWSHDFNDIEFLANRLIAQGYKNAEIIVYFDGNRLPLERAKLIAGKHTQLNLYLEKQGD